MGSEKDESLTLHGLNSARGYLQSKVAERVKTRYTPELRFEVDKGLHKSFETTRILRDVLPMDESDQSSTTDEAEPESIDNSEISGRSAD